MSRMFAIVTQVVGAILFVATARADACDGEEGAAKALCNVYCVALECGTPEQKASDVACQRVSDNFTKQTGRELSCDGGTLTCELDGGLLTCSATGTAPSRDTALYVACEAATVEIAFNISDAVGNVTFPTANLGGFLAANPSCVISGEVTLLVGDGTVFYARLTLAWP